MSGAEEQTMNKALLEITMKVSDANRPKAGAIYAKYKPPFLATVPGAESKDLLLRAEDVQVLHSFDSRASAEKYLASKLFAVDVVEELKPYLLANPEIRIYERQ
jgi:hypothetical protein